jgi:peptidoglycan/xylan/chitin deacetylase (PgdA/CDA1 family)/GT2 family glycosyltransferase
VARHVWRREPRAHWILLGLALLVLLAELSFGGMVRHVGYQAARTADHGGPAPAAVTKAGPVLDLRPDGTVASRRPDRRTLVLTFDDGPDPRWTPAILDVLARHDARATFFVIGANVNEHPGLVRRMVAEGHEVGVHTFTHVDLTAQPRWRRDLELTLTRQAVAAVTGHTPTLMRPPYSSTPAAVTAADHAALRDAAAAGFLVVLADHDPRDWRPTDPAAIVRAATPASDRGGVVLLHDGGGDRGRTVVALDTLLTRLGKRGYRFTTVSGALDLPPAPAASTAVTMRGTALRWAQAASDAVAAVMRALLIAAIAMSLLRLVLQLVAARVHLRRSRREHRLRYLGPVTVIVPAFNEAANIAATVRSLVANDYPDLDVIVVDDGSTDDTAGIVRRLRLPGVRVLRQRNAGKPAALNLGIAHARADLLVLVDGDTVFEPDAVGRLVQPFARADVGAVSGNTKVANRRGLLGRWQHLEYVMGFNLDRRLSEVAGCMTTVPGAIGAFRRAALADVGGVPAVTLAEDTDLTMAIVRAGWRVVYAERAVAWTEAPSSLRQLWRQRYRWCYGTMQAMWKHRRAVVSRGPAGRLGRRGLTYLLGWQILLPLAAPAVDVYAVYGLLFLPVGQVVALWSGFVLAQAVVAAYALRLDGERLAPLWTLPLQQLVYRQLMYLVVVQSAVTALTGVRLPWQRLVRTGQAASAVPGGVTPTPSRTL